MIEYYLEKFSNLTFMLTCPVQASLSIIQWPCITSYPAILLIFKAVLLLHEQTCQLYMLTSAYPSFLTTEPNETMLSNCIDGHTHTHTHKTSRVTEWPI